jgi:hypothetical protein
MARFAGKPLRGMPGTTDAVLQRLAEDERMPSIWIIVTGVVGALNVRLIAPGVAAFFGVGKWSVTHDPDPDSPPTV